MPSIGLLIPEIAIDILEILRKKNKFLYGKPWVNPMAVCYVLNHIHWIKTKYDDRMGNRTDWDVIQH